jgi:hypothetical protein
LVEHADQRLVPAHAPRLHQAFDLLVLPACGDPDRVTPLSQAGLQQFDRLNHHNLGLGPGDDLCQPFADPRVEDPFQVM